VVTAQVLFDDVIIISNFTSFNLFIYEKDTFPVKTHQVLSLNVYNFS